MQLPISDIITEACRDTWDKRRDLLAFAFLPVLAVSIVSTVMAALFGDAQITVDDGVQVPFELVVRSIISALVSFVFYTLFAVAWHRRILVGPETGSIGAAFRWGPRQWLFLRHIVLLFVYLMAFIFFMSLLLARAFPIAFTFSALFIAAGLIGSRLVLVLPAAATDTPMKFTESAKLTSGNSWRILVAVILLPLLIIFLGSLPVLIILNPLAAVIASSMTAQFLVSLALESVFYIGYAVGITALSISYRRLTA